MKGQLSLGDATAACHIAGASLQRRPTVPPGLSWLPLTEGFLQHASLTQPEDTVSLEHALPASVQSQGLRCQEQPSFLVLSWHSSEVASIQFLRAPPQESLKGPHW